MKLKALMKVIDKETFVIIIKSGNIVIADYKGRIDRHCKIDDNVNVKLIKNTPEYLAIIIS